MKSIFPYVPGDFQPRNLKCAACQQEFPLPLTKRYEHPLAHVRPSDFHPVTNNVYWQIHSLEIPCPKCRHKTPFVLPSVPMKVVLPLYGDEASRELTGQCVQVLAFVGSDPRLEASVRQTWHEMKIRITPDRAPESWRLHMMELWKTSGGRRHPVFHAMTPEQRMAAKEAVADAYFSLRNDVFSFVGIYRAPKLTRGVKQQALLSVLAYMLERLCPRGTAPKVTLESDQLADGKAGMSYGTTHAVKEFQRSLLYAILCQGLPVEEIAAARSTDVFWFELADYVAYVVARACLRRWQGIAPDLDPARLGTMFWIGTQPGGNIYCDRCQDIPWDKFGGWPAAPAAPT